MGAASEDKGYWLDDITPLLFIFINQVCQLLSHHAELLCVPLYYN